MAINNQGLKNLFGGQNNNNAIFEEDDDNQNFTLPEMEEDDLLPAAPVLRNSDATPVTQQDMIADTRYALDTTNDLINQSQKLIQIALENASNGGNARDIEVAAEAIEKAQKVVESLMTIHEKRMKISQPDMGNNNTYVQNQIVYQGTTKDAISAIRNGTIDIDGM